MGRAVRHRRAPTRWVAVAGLLVVVLVLTAGGLVPGGAPTAAGLAGRPSGPGGAPRSTAIPPAPTGPVTVAPPDAIGPGIRPVAPVPPDLAMNVLVGLAGSDPSGLAARVAAAYTPGSTLYHDYLTPADVAAQFGASTGTLAAAVRYFNGFGLTATPLGGGTLIEVRGGSGAIARAFGTSFDLYRAPDGRSFVGHPTPAVLPAGIPWTAAVGLGNASLPVPLAVPTATLPAVGRAPLQL
ncbi:secreted protein containing Peptidase S53, propeptide domain protein, partial [mine drainage metagenome]